VFDRIGLFDEELVRNQDDELNARLLRAGGRILLVPDVVSEYFARGTLRKTARMFYQYGLFKPLAAHKAGAIFTLRQLVPAAFVMSLALTALLAWWSPLMRSTAGAVLGLYALALGGAAVGIAPRAGVRVAAATLAVFPTLHVSYGVGFLRGLVTPLRSRHHRARVGAVLPLSR
jgi:hypothetical protein